MKLYTWIHTILKLKVYLKRFFFHFLWLYWTLSPTVQGKAAGWMRGQPVGYKRAATLHSAHSLLHHVPQAEIFLQQAARDWTKVQPSLIQECTSRWSPELDSSQDILKFSFLRFVWPGRDPISAVIYKSLKGEKWLTMQKKSKACSLWQLVRPRLSKYTCRLNLHLQTLRSVERLAVFLSLFLKPTSFNWFQRKSYQNQISFPPHIYLLLHNV